jgi:TatD DNase family protein
VRQRLPGFAGALIGLLETDAPDMPLKGFQGQPNRPERARQVWETLCTLRGAPASAGFCWRAHR